MGVCALILVGALASGVTLVDTHAPPLPLGRAQQVLVDDNGDLDLAGALRSDRWQPARSTEVTFGLHKAVIWVRFDVDVIDSDDWMLWARFPRPRTLEHWALDADGAVVAHAVSGEGMRRDERPVDDVELLLPLGRARTHVLRAEARPARLNFLVGSTAAISEARANDGVAAGLYYGIFVGLFCFNLAFGFATKDPAHVLYCVFVICMALHMAVRDGWLPPELPEAIFGRGAGMPITGLAMLAFTRRFLAVDTALPRFRRVYDAALVVTAIMAALPFTGLDLARPAGWLTIVDILVVLVSAAVLVARGDKPALLFLLAWALMIASSVLAVCHALGVIDLPWAATSGVRVGAAIEMVLLSLALAARVGVLRKARDVAERALHEARLTQQQQILQKVLAAQESERERFARDLHDGLGHSLLLLKQRSATSAPELKDDLGDALDDVRRLARALAPATLERLGLISALRALCESHEKSTGVVVVFDCGLVDDDVSVFADNAIHAYRIVQEALANATRHGAAQRIDVEISREGKGLRLHIVDDGCGADDDGAGLVWGTGLTGMDQRARLLGGTFAFTTGERGSAVDVVVPLSSPVLSPPAVDGAIA